MKTRNPIIHAACACGLLFTTQSGFAQGSLTPTLAQIEPRTPISSAPFTITNSGSYYLTTNVTVSSGDGITIATNNVTLDLSGFTIASTASPATGIGVLLAGGCMNVAILNGFVVGAVTNNAGVYAGSGFGYGIYYSAGYPSNVRVSRISVSGCQHDGINLYVVNSVLVELCNVNMVGGIGILGETVYHSTALNCGDTGITSRTADDCNVFGAGSVGINCGRANNCAGWSSNSYGLFATTANDCSGTSYNGQGINAIVANNCLGTSATNCGLFVGSSATGCYGYSSRGTGLSAKIASSCYGYSDFSTGLSATIANSCVGTGSPALSVTNKYNMP